MSTNELGSFQIKASINAIWCLHRKQRGGERGGTPQNTCSKTPPEKQSSTQTGGKHLFATLHSRSLESQEGETGVRSRAWRDQTKGKLRLSDSGDVGGGAENKGSVESGRQKLLWTHWWRLSAQRRIRSVLQKESATHALGSN